ncbi:hypothetical protein [Coxiella-like endosymbiont]|uniref:hypothetical protein n=1 Tax=Coxiella-like endosymbiont TaxID=1592897 RepID=UPI002729AE8B|nr:hypothetical protein [Coxiella-like endosymbiont]
MACTSGSFYWKHRQGRYLGCNDFRVKTSRLRSAPELIGKTDYDFKRQKSIDYIMQSGKQLLEFLNGIIDIAKTEQKQLPD